MGTRAVLPGSLTRVFRGGPVGLYYAYPSMDVISDIADDHLDATDGLVLVLGADGDIWRFVMTPTGKLGWVCVYDLGISITGSVYSIR